MEPLTVLAWVGAVCLSVAMVAGTVLVVWSVVRELRGKSSPRKTRILN